jgi:hypothetical protein
MFYVRNLTDIRKKTEAEIVEEIQFILKKNGYF